LYFGGYHLGYTFLLFYDDLKIYTNDYEIDEDCDDECFWEGRAERDGGVKIGDRVGRAHYSRCFIYVIMHFIPFLILLFAS